MSLVPVDATNLKIALQNDAQQWRTTISWAKDRRNAYVQNLTAAQMTTLGISVADQAFITAFVADLGRFVQLSNGNLPADATNMTTNIQGILGVL